ncbi:MAG TPA: aldo/keto reductase [Thermomicrobiales bacterium]|nr:aldo/keto reductase [Thermomicrobiales bacterium]
MEQRPLGRTGLTVSALGYGAGSIGGLMVRGDAAEQAAAVARALAAGVTYFDTAPGYGDGRSEENLGQALREAGARWRVVVGTKVRLAPADLADPAAAIRRSIEASLRRLGRDAVDLLQLHNPLALAGRAADAAEVASGRTLDVAAALDGVAEGLRAVVRDGLAGHAGFTGLGDAAATREVARSGRFATVQCYFNALNPSAGFAGASGGGQDFAGLIDAAAGAGLGVIAIRCLAAGALAAQPERHANAGDPGAPLAGGAEYARDLARAGAIARLAADAGLEGPLELALRFALSKPGVSTALVGYSDLPQLESALRWAERGPLPDDLVRRALDLAREG